MEEAQEGQEGGRWWDGQDEQKVWECEEKVDTETLGEEHFYGEIDWHKAIWVTDHAAKLKLFKDHVYDMDSI